MKLSRIPIFIIFGILMLGLSQAVLPNLQPDVSNVKIINNTSTSNASQYIDCSGYGARSTSVDAPLSWGGASASTGLGCIIPYNASLIMMGSTMEVLSVSINGDTLINLSIGSTVTNTSLRFTWTTITTGSQDVYSTYTEGSIPVVAGQHVGCYQDRISGSYSATSTCNLRFKVT